MHKYIKLWHFFKFIIECITYFVSSKKKCIIEKYPSVAVWKKKKTLTVLNLI